MRCALRVAAHFGEWLGDMNGMTPNPVKTIASGQHQKDVGILGASKPHTMCLDQQ